MCLKEQIINKTQVSLGIQPISWYARPLTFPQLVSFVLGAKGMGEFVLLFPRWEDVVGDSSAPRHRILNTTLMIEYCIEWTIPSMAEFLIPIHWGPCLHHRKHYWTYSKHQSCVTISGCLCFYPQSTIKVKMSLWTYPSPKMNPVPQGTSCCVKFFDR